VEPEADAEKEPSGKEAAEEDSKETASKPKPRGSVPGKPEGAPGLGRTQPLPVTLIIGRSSRCSSTAICTSRCSAGSA
jgi:hypothetical protein